MKDFWVRLALLLIMLNASALPLAAIDSKTEEWLEDIQFLSSQLPLRHRNLFHSMSRSEYQSALDSLQQRLPTLTDDQIILELARLGAMIGDGHSGIRMLDDPAVGFRSFPLVLRLFEDGLYIVSAAREYSDLAGARVVKIEEQPWEGVWEKAAALVSADNIMMKKAFTPLLLTKVEVLQALGIASRTDRLDLVVEQNQKRREVEVAMLDDGHLPFDRMVFARRAGQPPVAFSRPGDFYWAQHLPESKTMFVQFNKVLNKKEETVDQFFSKVFDTINRTDVQRLVLDLRWNTGGLNILNRFVVTGIVRSPKINQRGRLFVLIGRNTFSAAINCINELEKYTQALFVGEPTGGSPNHYGVPAPIVLPNSGIHFFASTLWRQDADPADRRQWIAPDIAAPMWFAHYRDGVDPAMQAIDSYVPPRDIGEHMLELASAGKIGEARRALLEFRQNPYHRYVDTEARVNYVANMLMSGNQPAHAIELFRWNVEDHPRSLHALESFADACSRIGQKTLAADYYRKAIAMNPNSAIATAGLQKIELEKKNGVTSTARNRNTNRPSEIEASWLLQ